MSVTRIVIAICALCIAVELVLQLADLGLIAWPRMRATAYEYGGFWPGLLGSWRPNYALQPLAMFATYGFLHTGLGHLALNMVALVVLARLLSGRVSGPGLLSIYALSLVGAALCFAALADTYRPVVGASGALFGLIGAFLWSEVVERRTADQNAWQVVTFVLVIVALQAAQLPGLGEQAWQAHLGGFVTGGAVAVLRHRT